MKKVEKGNKIKVHYTGTLNDGNKFDSSHDRGDTLNFEVGAGQMIKGFDAAVLGMETGETKKINLKPTDAYGDINPKALTEVPTQSFPTDFNPKVDEMVQGSTIDGKPVIAKVKELKESTIVLDLNHPLAGQELNFEIELVEIEE
jgi:FKBP-type peptidyl-prolyl cis-trans isomerase 2